MPKSRDVEAELKAMSELLDRFSSFMAVIAGQSALDALDFVCEETSRDICSKLPAASAEIVIAELLLTRLHANRAFAAAQLH